MKKKKKKMVMMNNKQIIKLRKNKIPNIRKLILLANNNK